MTLEIDLEAIENIPVITSNKSWMIEELQSAKDKEKLYHVKKEEVNKLKEEVETTRKSLIKGCMDLYKNSREEQRQNATIFLMTILKTKSTSITILILKEEYFEMLNMDEIISFMKLFQSNKRKREDLIDHNNQCDFSDSDTESPDILQSPNKERKRGPEYCTCGVYKGLTRQLCGKYRCDNELIIS